MATEESVAIAVACIKGAAAKVVEKALDVCVLRCGCMVGLHGGSGIKAEESHKMKVVLGSIVVVIVAKVTSVDALVV